MSQYLLFAIVGLGAGAVYAGLAMGLITTYRGTGVLNIAHAAMAIWGAYVYAELRETGQLVLPVTTLRLGAPLAQWPAFAIGVASAALLGLLVHLLVFRWLRMSPTVARVVASVGVMITLHGLMLVQFGSEAQTVAPLLPDESMTFAGISFSRDRPLLL